MKWVKIPLILESEQETELEKLWDNIVRYHSNSLTIEPKNTSIERMFTIMSEVAKANPQIQVAINQSENGSEHIVLNLQHDNRTILNLPWHGLKDCTGKSLSSLSQLTCVRSFPECFSDLKFKPRALPMKVLVVVSSPDDLTFEGRLDYETEMSNILTIFYPLMKRGEIIVDIADDASLIGIEKKIIQVKYDILHFSGHGSFNKDTGEGHILLENEDDMNMNFVNAKEFAEVLNSHPEHRIPLVVMSSCHTAHSDSSFKGVTDQLIRVGTPAVISMVMSVGDDYATEFSNKFYENICNRYTIPQSYRKAVEALRVYEYDRHSAKKTSHIPTQWMIPSLTVSEEIEKLTDFDLVNEIRDYESQDVFSGKRYISKPDKEYLFIGRWRDVKRYFGELKSKGFVLITGQGGIGKTYLAEELIRRYCLKQLEAIVFAFDEKNLSGVNILDKGISYLKDDGDFDFLKTYKDVKSIEDKFLFLFNLIAKQGKYPIFVFDNLESFMDDDCRTFKPEHSEIVNLITLLQRIEKFPLIMTSRYAFETEYYDINQHVDLKSVSFTDYWRKAKDTKNIISELGDTREDFKDNLFLLYNKLGGNYRALEFIDTLLSTVKSDDLMKAIESVQDKMVENLLFNKIIELLDDSLYIFRFLMHFDVPVTTLALELQGLVKEKIETALKRINSLTLCERMKQDETDLYYITPLIKDLYKKNYLNEDIIFSHEMAGRYFTYRINNGFDSGMTSLINAFEHFCLSDNKKQINDLGNRISFIFEEKFMFEMAHYYADKSYSILGDECNVYLIHRLGFIELNIGRYDNALTHFNKCLKIFEEIGDKSGEGTCLNNIGQIYASRGDYDTALSYLEHSLKIRQEIGDKSGEGQCLNNISQIYASRGDYDTALSYLEHSLKIRQEIGDKSGEGQCLNNISQIYDSRGDYDTALSYLERSLKIRQDIGDKSGEGTCLNNISQIYDSRGDYDTALSYLERSLKIRQDIGDKSGEGQCLNNISQIYASRRDYDTALSYLERSLKIFEEIGDKSGEGYTLYNLAFMLLINLNEPEKGMKCLIEALKINQKVGDAELGKHLSELFTWKKQQMEEQDA